MKSDFFDNTPVSEMIWEEKYRFVSNEGEIIDHSVEDMWRRVARVAARAEKKSIRSKWRGRFYEALEDFAFLPGGRILAGAGTSRKVTLFNCFVMNAIEDDTSSIFDNLREGALTMQKGGGIGMDFSTLRPEGALVRGVGAGASGPVHFMALWDAMCGTIRSSGARRGAMMAVLDISHPDIEKFIEAKAKAGNLTNFNLSVLVRDGFMQAVEKDADWPLEFDGTVYRTVRASDLYDKIMRATYDQAEPGILFIDEINRRNKLSYCETINATNPCGEQPLPPYGACMLGSINLARLIEHPFAKEACLDEKRLQNLVSVAVRFLDNIIDISNYPLKQQSREAKAKRRIGLGITGLADGLIMCGARYGSERSLKLAAEWMSFIQNAAYRASAALAEEKGVFPLYDKKQHVLARDMKILQPDVLELVKAKGLRNGLLTSIAPTGTISLLAGNVSGGVEPVFDLSYERVIKRETGAARQETVDDYAYRIFRKLKGPEANLPKSFVTAHELKPRDHLAMQAAVQPFVDSAISKTINCPEDISYDEFKNIYSEAYRLGLKGCTTYRPNAITGSVLNKQDETPHNKAMDKGASQADNPLRVQSSLPLPALAQRKTPLSDGGNENGDIVYLADPMERGATLAGYTYKLRWPDSEHAIYVTINDVLENDRRRPFEIFINSKNLEHYAWTVALTRMISAVFRRGGDVFFVVEELKAVFDPRGGQWMNGHYVPSLLAAIGEIVEKHMIDIGFATPEKKEFAGDTENEQSSRARYCPKCAQPALVMEEGCYTCRQCGYSKCS